MAERPADRPVVGLVLAGGGARGAYELGALSVLLPELEGRGERPTIIVGTSVGALNAAFLAARADRPLDAVLEEGARLWSEIRYDEALEPLLSPGSLLRVLRYAGQFLGVPGARVESVLDPAPLRATLRRVIDFRRLDELPQEALQAAAVVTTSAHTSRSVVFHRGGDPPERDERRGIDYVRARLSEEHVLASAAIPTAFPAVHVGAPERARGWYFDGGTRLNTPIKPALELGAERVLVIGLNSIAPAPPELASERRPDALDGAGQLVQAVLVDPLAHDVQTLATINRLLMEAPAPAAGKRPVPYIFVAPRRRDAIGAVAARVFREHYARPPGALRSPGLALLGRAVAGGSDAAHGELVSYLLFAAELGRELQELGRRDAQEWLSEPHDDGPWQLGPLLPR